MEISTSELLKIQSLKIRDLKLENACLESRCDSLMAANKMLQDVIKTNRESCTCDPFMEIVLDSYSEKEYIEIMEK